MSDKFQKLTELVSNIMEGYTTALFLADPAAENIVLFRSSSFSKKIDSACRLKSGEGLIGWVFREQKQVLASNFERDTTTLKIYHRDEKIKSLLALPLPHGKGVLYVDSKKSYSFAEEKEKIFQQLAAVAATMIIDHQSLAEGSFLKQGLAAYSRLEEYLRYNQAPDFGRFASFLGQGFSLSHMFLVLPGKTVFSHVWRGDSERATEHPLEFYSADGLLGWCLKNRQKMKRGALEPQKHFILNNEEYFEKISNFLGIPLLTLGKTSGVLGVVRSELKKDVLPFQDEIWSSAEMDILETMAKMFIHRIA